VVLLGSREEEGALPIQHMRIVHVQDLLMEGEKELGLRVVSGSGGLGRPIFSSKVQRPGKELRRDPPLVKANRILLLGRTELGLLDALVPSRRRMLLRELSFLDLPCILVEGGLRVPEDLLQFSQEYSIPLLATRLGGIQLTRGLHRILGRIMGDGVHIQGVLMRIFDVGVLILGKSGIGKSECALDLITRGHALVADDLVELRRGADGEVLGTCPELIKYHMEVRGLGIINILALFGERAVIEESTIGLVVELLEWEQILHMDRTGLPQRTFTLLDRDLPLLRIPVSLNRNLAIILEVAVRNQLLKERGIRPVEDLAHRIETELRSKASS